MATVRDPNFWKRFSAAVHQDELEKGKAAQTDLKHSYVTTAPLPSPTTPTSYTFVATIPIQPLSPVALLPLPSDEPPLPPPKPRRLSKLSYPQAWRNSRSSIRADAKPPMRRSSLAHVQTPFTRQTHASQLTLGLSGRPQSRFKFWTQVSADPSNRSSWLAGQRRKEKQRTWMCWVFWVLFLVLVAGVVVCVLLLKEKGII